MNIGTKGPISLTETISAYGLNETILGIFLFLFLGAILYLLKSNRDYTAQVIDQNKILIEFMMNSNSNESEKNNTTENNEVFKMYMKLNSRLTSECKDTLNVIDADRTGIYAFHNGSTSITGFHFLKVSCICEYFARGHGVSKMQEHSNIPVSLLDDTIAILIKDGNHIIYNSKDYMYSNANLITCKLLLQDTRESCILYTIFAGEENTPVGFILSEFNTSKFTFEELKEKRQYLHYLADKVGPILEVSAYCKKMTEHTNESGV